MGEPMMLTLFKPEQSSKCGMRLHSVLSDVHVLAVGPDSLTAAAGVLPGDRLLQVAGRDVESGDQVGMLLSQAVGEVPIVVLRMPKDAPPPTLAAAPEELQAPTEQLQLTGSEETQGASQDFVYHEKQLSALCGVHAINNLLQGPYYGAGDLADIARAIDEREKALLTEAPAAVPAAAPVDPAKADKAARELQGRLRLGLSKDDYASMKQGLASLQSSAAAAVAPTPAAPAQSWADRHVDEISGEFSIEVLCDALATHDVRLLNAEHETLVVEVNEAPENEQAFLCHRRGHWFALRSLGGMWWNLDSTLPRPGLISPPLLSTFLAVQRAEGHTVHVVRGAPLPLPQCPAGQDAGAAGREETWHPLGYLMDSQTGGDGAPHTEEAYGALVLGPGARGSAQDTLDAVQVRVPLPPPSRAPCARPFGCYAPPHPSRHVVQGALGDELHDMDAALAASLAAEDALQAEQADAALAVQLVAEAEEARERQEQLQQGGGGGGGGGGSSVLRRMGNGLDSMADSVAGGFSSVGSWLRTPRGGGGSGAATATATPPAATHAAPGVPAAHATQGMPAAAAAHAQAAPAEPSLWDLPTAAPAVPAAPAAPTGGAQAPAVPFRPLISPPSAPAPAPAAPAAPAPPTVSVPQLLQMGFSWAEVHRALETTGDLGLAQEMLLSQRNAALVAQMD